MPAPRALNYAPETSSTKDDQKISCKHRRERKARPLMNNNWYRVRFSHKLMLFFQTDELLTHNVPNIFEVRVNNKKNEAYHLYAVYWSKTVSTTLRRSWTRRITRIFERLASFTDSVWPRKPAKPEGGSTWEDDKIITIVAYSNVTYLYLK